MPTISEYARARGVSHQYISKLVKRGMSLATFDSADAWRDAHASSKASTNPTRIARMMDDGSDPGDGRARERISNETFNKHPSDIALEQALMNTRHAADEAWRLLQEAMIEGRASKIQVLLSIHNKAVDALFRAESAHRGELERRRILIPLTEAMEMARRGYAVILQRLNALPQNVASQCNPADPSRAMTALESECSAILCAAQEVYRLWSKDGPHISTATDKE